MERINNITDYVDESGRLTKNIYNEAGGLLARKGQKFNDKLKRMPTYTFGVSVCKTAADLLEQNERKLKKSGVGPATMEVYADVYEMFRKNIVEETLTVKNYSNVAVAIDEICRSSVVSPLQLRKCIMTIDDRDTYTLNHSLSVMLLMYQALHDIEKYTPWQDDLKNMFGTLDLGFESKRCYLIGALLHDYGKSWVPRRILQKEDKLTDMEYERVMQHPQKGVTELKYINIEDERILRLVGNHHVSYMVYRGLGQQPLESVLNILDIYDACRSDRPYAKPLSLKRTLKVINIEQRAAGWADEMVNFLTNVTIASSEVAVELSSK